MGNNWSNAIKVLVPIYEYISWHELSVKTRKKPLKLYVDPKPYTLIVMWNLNQSNAIKIG
jgi:hypothetical protein